ncbi:MAG: DUF389 domain-containing protein [Streptosporangiaceae bacterium]
MLHIRVVSPPAVTGRLLTLLRADDGVINLVVLPAAAPGAAGTQAADAVQFDVFSAGANGVLRQLRDLGLDRTSSIIIETVDAAITSPASRAARRSASHGEQAPVWELIEARIADNARYPPSFFVLLVLAALIGACGIFTNSQTLIVGAMVVGPEYSAIISVALGLERRNRRAVGRGLLVLLLGFLGAIAVTLLFALCIRGLGKAPEPFLHGVRPVSDLINSPNLFSVIVAVVAGLVGVVSLTLSRTGALIGVFISVTTIPAAADVALSTAFGAWHEAVGSLMQLLLNVGVLIVVGALALRAQRLIWRRWTARPPVPPVPPAPPVPAD